MQVWLLLLSLGQGAEQQLHILVQTLRVAYTQRASLPASHHTAVSADITCYASTTNLPQGNHRYEVGERKTQNPGITLRSLSSPPLTGPRKAL